MSTKLTKFHKSSKACWPLLRTFLNNKEIPWILPLYHQGDFVTNFKKSYTFQFCFDSQCSLIKNNSKLPSHLNYKTKSLLLFANFSIDDIAKILQNLGSNNAHDNDIVFAWYNYEVIQATVRHWSSFSNSL